MIIYYYLQYKHFNYNKTCNMCFHTTNSNKVHQIQLVTSDLADHSTEKIKMNKIINTECIRGSPCRSKDTLKTEWNCYWICVHS